MNLWIFATVYNLMKGINMIDSCQTLARTIRFKHRIHSPEVTQMLTVVIDSDPHLIRTCKTSLSFAPLVVGVHTGLSAYLFYTPTKPLI